MRVNPAPGVHWTCTDRGGAVLNLHTERWTILDPTAAHMWAALADGTDIEDLATALAHTHDVPLERVTADIAHLLDQARAAYLTTDHPRPRRFRRPR
ncbi:PqqD family protein [Embleya sp. NPDC059237]|uniref:PqqD family protein n=1 Tax=Embleya sp. NPDC059237 TaxID=3346784 RepID=UPI0036A3E1C5